MEEKKSKKFLNCETEGDVPHRIFKDFEILVEISDESFGHLIDLVISFLAQDLPSDFFNLLHDFAKEHDLSHLHSIENDVSADSKLKDLVAALIFFFQSILRSHLSPSLIMEDLSTLGVPPERIDKILMKWKQKGSSLSRISVFGQQPLMVNQLVNLEWKSGVTASNSELNKVGTAFLQLKLVLDKGNNTTEDVVMELSLPQFYQFLHEMQKAKTNLDFFT